MKRKKWKIHAKQTAALAMAFTLMISGAASAAPIPPDGSGTGQTAQGGNQTSQGGGQNGQQATGPAGPGSGAGNSGSASRLPSLSGTVSTSQSSQTSQNSAQTGSQGSSQGIDQGSRKTMLPYCCWRRWHHERSLRWSFLPWSFKSGLYPGRNRK